MRRREFVVAAGSALAGAAAGIRPAAAEPQAKRAGGTTRVQAVIRELRLRQAWTLSRGTWTTRRNVFVRLERDGVAGYGEAAPIARYNETAESALAFVRQVEPLLQGDLWAFQDLWMSIDRSAPGEHAAKTALDLAVLDWATKTLHIPLYRWLGADPRRAPRTTYSIGIDEVPVMQEKVRQAAGFSVYKIKVGTADDRKIIEGIRAVTDKPLRADANEGWKSREEALEMITWMAKRGVELIEQPLPASQLDDYRWLKERTPIPIFADESLMTTADIPGLAGAFDGVNVKLMKCGGVQEAVRMAAVARAVGLKLMLGCMIESSLGIAAAAAVSPLFDYADLDGNLLIDNDPFRGLGLDGDRLVLSPKPGLGVEGDVWGRDG